MSQAVGAYTPVMVLESMRIDISKDPIEPEQRRAEGVQYLLSDRPEFIDRKPTYQVINVALKK